MISPPFWTIFRNKNARGLCKGAIGFGLVHVPVALIPAEKTWVQNQISVAPKPG